LRWRHGECSATDRRAPPWGRRATVRHTAHHPGAGIEICYPYNPLYRQTATVLRVEHTKGESHLRVITEAGEERLIPRWMSDPNAFQPSSVEQPLIGLDALRDLLRVVFSSPLHQSRRDQEGRRDDPIAPVSAASEPQRATFQQGVQRSERPCRQPADCSDCGEQQETAAAGDRQQ
jgi:hypothetical protein